MPCAPTPARATAQAVLLDGASPPNELPIEPVNMVCAEAELSNATTAMATAARILIVRKRPSRVDDTRKLGRVAPTKCGVNHDVRVKRSRLSPRRLSIDRK